MARLVKTVTTQTLTCDIITIHTDDTTSTREVKVDDITENLRYVENNQVKSVSGRVNTITRTCPKVTKVDLNNVVDYFAADVIINSLTIDASEQYHSRLVTVPAIEIVEDYGEVNVKRMKVKARPYVTMLLEYTDGSRKERELEVGDVLKEMVILTTPGKPSIKGDFTVGAFMYESINKNFSITGMYLVPLGGGKAVAAKFSDILELVEIPQIEVTDTESLSAITAALNMSETGEAIVKLDVDVEIPRREDGRITTTMINANQTVDIDMNGHTIKTRAYAFYVNGGTLNISDSGDGAIICTEKNNAYPAVFVGAGGTCNMESGTIDTSQVVLEDDDYNWMYGVVCSGDGVFNMSGGKMIIGAASGIAITNGTASGEGARFTIGGDAEITSLDCAAIYLADNKSVVITDNATINGGIVARMGDITVDGHATVNGSTSEMLEPLGNQVCISGVGAPSAAILALTGVYGSSLGNDMNIFIGKDAKVNGKIDDGIDIAMVNTKFDQYVTVEVENSAAMSQPADLYRIYTHDELAELATAQGKTLGPETNSTDLTVKVDGAVVYPVVDENEEEG